MGFGKITAKQQQILDYIKQEILNRGYPPTVREICETVNLKSTSSVHSHLETLEKNGYIRRDPTKPRAIEICDDSFQMVRTEMVSLPVIGRVAAGTPILAEQNILNLNACIGYPEVEDEYLTKNSVQFHEHMGYRFVGEFYKCGYKFGRWYNMVWMEKHIGEHLDDQPAIKKFDDVRIAVAEKYGIE